MQEDNEPETFRALAHLSERKESSKLMDLKSYGLNHCHPSRGPLIKKKNLPAALLVRILPYKVQSFLLSL